MRLRIAVPGLVLLCALVLAACGSSSSSSSGGGGGSSKASAKSSGAPLVIGLVPPSAGALAVFGKNEVQAWQFAADQANAAGGVDGHKVQLVTGSTDVTPAATLRAARSLVLQKNAHFLGAIISSPEVAALNPQLAGLNAVLFNSTAKDNFLTGAQCSANTVNVVQSAKMDTNQIGQSLSKLPAKKWAIVAEDYSTGHDSAAAFAAAVKKGGGTVVKTIYAPLNTTDFGAYISQLGSSGADGLFAVEYGADGVAFVNQAAQFGLLKKLKTFIGFNTVSEPLFPVLGKKILGFYNNIGYVHQQPYPMNKTFASAWKAKYGTDPYYVEADEYLAAEALFTAVKKAHSVDPTAVKAALKGLSFDSIDGPVSIRPADMQVLRPSNLGQVVSQPGGAGGLGWKIISTAPASSTTPSPDPSCHIS
ncbi:MAG: branched-chain amino acid transport system substrate-binding protein [Chloroflexota bacterium]|nr:branched-chain amino acid transport system substrate-binding protein [Chloroflexota bacterium]